MAKNAKKVEAGIWRDRLALELDPARINELTHGILHSFTIIKECMTNHTGYMMP